MASRSANRTIPRIAWNRQHSAARTQEWVELQWNRWKSLQNRQSESRPVNVYSDRPTLALSFFIIKKEGNHQNSKGFRFAEPLNILGKGRGDSQKSKENRKTLKQNKVRKSKEQGRKIRECVAATLASHDSNRPILNRPILDSKSPIQCHWGEKTSVLLGEARRAQGSWWGNAEV